MGKNEARIDLVADSSKLKSELGKSDRDVRNFGSSVKNVFSNIKSKIDEATDSFGTFGKVAVAYAASRTLKKLFSLEEFMKVDDALLMMQANLKMSAKELDGFKSKMVAMAGSHGEDMGALFSASAKLSKSYKPDDILKIMDASSMASNAMEQDLTSVEERIVQIMKMYRKTPDEAKKIAEALVASNADMGTLDTLLQRGILKGGAGKDYQEILALASAIKKAGADSPRVVMGIESIVNTIEEKAPILKKAGIDIFKIDPKTGKKVKKDLIETLQELEPVLAKRKKMLGDEEYNKRLDETFGQGTHEALPFLFSQKDSIKKALEDQGNAAQIAAQRATKADEKWSKQLNKVKGHLDAIKTDSSEIYDRAKKPVKFLADSPNLTKGLGIGAAGLSLAALGALAFGKGRQLLKYLTPGPWLTNSFNAAAPVAAAAVIAEPYWENYQKKVFEKFSDVQTTESRAQGNRVFGERGINPINNITLSVYIDNEGRVQTNSNDINTHIKINRGEFNSR